MKQFLHSIRKIGPALILAAVVLGPGSITLSTIAGSLYGYRLLWVIVMAAIFMILYTLLAARIALATGLTLFEATRRRYGSGVARLGGLFGFLSIGAFQAGNSAAVGFVGEAIFGLDSRFAALIFFLPACGLLLLPRLYTKVEQMVKIAIGLMMLGFVGTLVLVGVDFPQMAKGLVPGFPDTDSVFLALGMAATTFSIAAAAYQNHLMREKDWGPEDLATEGMDTFFGIGILGLLSAIVLLTSAGVLYGRQDFALSAQTMALQLEPLVGPAAFYLFTGGFFFASFSSLVVNPLIGSALLLDGFGKDPKMDNAALKGWAIVAMAFGVVVVLLFSGSPVELLRIAQALAVVAFPLLGFLVWRLAADRSLMGKFANTRGMNLAAGCGYLAVLAIVLNFLRQIF